MGSLNQEKVDPLVCYTALWFRTAMNRDMCKGLFARLFARKAHAFACCLLCSSTPMSSFIYSLTHSQTHGRVDDKMSQNDLVLSHSALVDGAPIRKEYAKKCHTSL